MPHSDIITNIIKWNMNVMAYFHGVNVQYLTCEALMRQKQKVLAN